MLWTQNYIYTYILKVYTILLLRDLKNPNVAPHPPPTTDHQNKKKVSALKIQILIKYKRIKWTPSCKASLLLPGGIKKSDKSST